MKIIRVQEARVLEARTLPRLNNNFVLVGENHTRFRTLVPVEGPASLVDNFEIAKIDAEEKHLWYRKAIVKDDCLPTEIADFKFTKASSGANGRPRFDPRVIVSWRIADKYRFGGSAEILIKQNFDSEFRANPSQRQDFKFDMCEILAIFKFERRLTARPHDPNGFRHYLHWTIQHREPILSIRKRLEQSVLDRCEEKQQRRKKKKPLAMAVKA